MSDSLTTETAATQAAPDYVNEREEGRKALKELLKPVQGSLMIGRILAGLSGVLAIAPYIALVQLGGLFATAYATGQPVDADRAMLIVQILISTFCLRILLLFIALGGNPLRRRPIRVVCAGPHHRTGGQRATGVVYQHQLRADPQGAA